MEDAEFDHLGVFAYSKEDGTPSAAMKPQIKVGVKKARRQELMTIQANIAKKNGQRLVGQILKVIVDGSIGPDHSGEIYSGRSARDAYEVDGSVFFPSPLEWLSGDFVHIKITKAKDYDLYGELVTEELATKELEVEPIEV